MDILENNKKKELKNREIELKNLQLPDVLGSKKLRSSDITKIVKNTNISLFDKKECCLWTGYITRSKNNGSYINFYFKNKKKTALHRLLYANFKGDLGEDYYIKYTCENKGICCNINHMVKYKYDEKQAINDTVISRYKPDDFKITIY